MTNPKGINELSLTTVAVAKVIVASAADADRMAINSNTGVLRPGYQGYAMWLEKKSFKCVGAVSHIHTTAWLIYPQRPDSMYPVAFRV